MKKIISTVCIVLFVAQIHSYAQDTTHQLITLPKISDLRPHYVGLYVAPEFQYGQANGSFTSFGGASAMLLLNKKWALGVTAAEGVDEAFSPKGVAPLYLKTGFAGIKMEYTARPNAKVHLSFPLVVGYGSAQADSTSNDGGGRGGDGKKNDDNQGSTLKENGNSTDYVVVQPSIQLEANLMRFAKLYAGVNYRLAFASETSTLPKNALSGLSLNVGLKLGLFDLWVGKKVKTEPTN